MNMRGTEQAEMRGAIERADREAWLNRLARKYGIIRRPETLNRLQRLEQQSWLDQRSGRAFLPTRAGTQVSYSVEAHPPCWRCRWPRLIWLLRPIRRRPHWGCQRIEAGCQVYLGLSGEGKTTYIAGPPS